LFALFLFLKRLIPIQVIQRPQSMDLPLYLNTNEKSKQQSRAINQDELSINDTQKRLVGYASIVSLTSTIPNESETLARPEVGFRSNRLSRKQHNFGKTKTSLIFFLI
jgi:hypothetical protein